MDKFFSNLKGKDAKSDKDASWQGGRSDMSSLKGKSNAAASSNNNSKAKEAPKNLFASANTAIKQQMDKLNNKPKAATSTGRSLGGSKPGTIHVITLSHPGSLGLEIEKRRDAARSAIVSSVVPDSQAAHAGLRRGDVVCRWEDESEYGYDEFLKWAKSNARPMRFKVRRMEYTAAAADSSSSTTCNGTLISADAMHRKQAMIAAAEAREAKYKKYVKQQQQPQSSSLSNNNKALRENHLFKKETTTNNKNNKNNEYKDSDNIDTLKAIQAIKAIEERDVKTLGYNPYESRAMTAGQARNAQVTHALGSITVDVDAATNNIEDGATTAFADDINNSNNNNDNQATKEEGVPHEFEIAFRTLVTSSTDESLTKKSLSTIRKLIINATTKGLLSSNNNNNNDEEDEASAKYRKIRLSNPKIKQAITDMNGALELMMSIGFVLCENQEDGETYLVYPLDCGRADWLDGGLEMLERYERGC